MIKPNLNLPLASSYNERGVTGYTHTVTNSEDQRKINCMYEITKNSVTGQGKLTLTKRPGITKNIVATHGTSTQTAYAICTDFISSLTSEVVGPIVFNVTTIGDANPGRVRADSTTIYSVSSSEVWIPVFVDKTYISGIETVVVQLKSVNVSTPFPNEKVFFCSGSLGAGFTQITDTDFVSAGGSFVTIGKMEHMDGYAFEMVSNNTIINSDLNSLLNWTSTGFVTKQIQADMPVGIAKFGNQILAFGDNSVEAFYNAGNATGSPLSPIKQLAAKIGLVHGAHILGQSNYYAIQNNKMYFVGRSSGGRFISAGVFAYNGSTYEKVSNSYVDKIIGEAAYNALFSYFGIHSIGIHGRNAIVIDTTNFFLMFFPEWNEWFEWNSTVFKPVNNGRYFLGRVPNAHQTYSFDFVDNWQDDGVNFTSQTQFKLPQSGHQRTRMAEYGVLADTARSSNQLLVEFSDDDCQSFYQAGNIELARDIKTLNRGGSYRTRHVRLSSTNSLETRLHAFVARIE